MKYKITLPNGNDLTARYLGVSFVNGVGETDSDFLANKARIKGFEVETNENSEQTEKLKCPHCDKEYAKLEYLNSHIVKKHPEQIKKDDENG